MPQGKGTGVRDNSTLEEKLKLRRFMLNDMEQHHVKPVILEVFGGTGVIYRKVYANIMGGLVIEKEPRKIDLLAWQRPTWSVYQGDAIALLRAGIAGHLLVNVVEIDPYGHPWDAVGAFFESLSEGLREKPDLLWVVVNDGARQYLRRKASAVWDTPWLPKDLVNHYGNALEMNYLEVAKQMMSRAGASCGYDLALWEGYYCGHVLQNTHYLARFEV